MSIGSSGLPYSLRGELSLPPLVTGSIEGECLLYISGLELADEPQEGQTLQVCLPLTGFCMEGSSDMSKVHACDLPPARPSTRKLSVLLSSQNLLSTGNAT